MRSKCSHSRNSGVVRGCLLAAALDRPVRLNCDVLSRQNVYVNINRIMSVGNRLLESGHYASQQIKQISGQLEQEWKAFAAALDERSTLLEMSASFHQKCDQVRSRCFYSGTGTGLSTVTMKEPWKQNVRTLVGVRFSMSHRGLRAGRQQVVPSSYGGRQVAIDCSPAAPQESHFQGRFIRGCSQ